MHIKAMLIVSLLKSFSKLKSCGILTKIFWIPQILPDPYLYLLINTCL